jgi:hypothetical protein
MNAKIFDNVPLTDDVKLDMYMTTGVIKTLYQLEGGDKLIQQRKNEDRLVEINHYYIAKYQAQTKVLKTFIFFCCLAMIGSILYNKGLITMLTFTIYTGLLGFIMLYVIGRDIFNIFIRDSRNYDEIDYSLSYTPSFPDIDLSGNTPSAAELSNIPSCPI